MQVCHAECYLYDASSAAARAFVWSMLKSGYGSPSASKAYYAKWVSVMCTICGQSGCAPAGSTEPTGGLWLRAGEMDWAREARAGPS